MSTTFRIRQGTFSLHWHDATQGAGWGDETTATVFDESECARVLSVLSKHGYQGCQRVEMK